jgi:ketosteroid isomerase-like protein
MKTTLKATMWSLIIFAALQSCKPATNRNAELDTIKQFYMDYAKALGGGNYKTVGELYTDSGAIIAAQGQIMTMSLDSIKAMYGINPMPASDFRFDNLHAELLSDKSAMVNAEIFWHMKDQPDTSRILYTAVLLKSEKGWKIRHEHESPDLKTVKQMLKRMPVE